MIDKILDSFEQVQAKVKTEARELEDKLTKFGDSLDGYHDSIEEILKKFSNIILPLVQDDRKATLQTTLQTSIAQAKLGNVILNYPELIAWKETDTVQERSALIKEKITLLRPVLLALLENDKIKSDEIIRIVHEIVDIGIVVPESFTGEDDALREHQLELIRPKVAQLSTIFSAKESPLLFTASSFKDIPAFVGKLKDQTDDVSPFLYSEFTAATQSLIDNYTISSTPSAALQKAIVTELNTLIQKPETIYDATRFNGVFLSVTTEQLKNKHGAEGVQGTALIRYNRLLLDDAYPLELLGAYASDSTTSDSFVDTAKNVIGFVNALPTDTYAEGMLYIAGKPFVIATPDDLIDHNPTITYDLEDGTLLSVEKTLEKKLKLQLGKAEEGTATTVAVLETKLSDAGITADCIETIHQNDDEVTQYDATTGILNLAGAPFQISPTDALANHTPSITYDLKVPIVEISGEKLTIQLGKFEAETSLEELKAILEADENINSVTLSNANKYTKLIEDASKVTSYNKDTGLLIIVGEQFQLSPVNPWNLTNPILEVTYLQERGAAPIATVDDHSKELTLQLGAAGSRTTVQQLIDELKGKGSITDVIYTAPLIPAAPETTFKDYQTLTTTKYAALSNELDDLDGKVDFPPQVETTIEKIEQTVEELGLDTIDDSSSLVTLLANKLRNDWLKDYPDYHFLVNTAEHLIIDWLGMDASADQFNEVFKIINSSILEISEKKLTLKFTKADVFDPAKTSVSFNLDVSEPRVTLNEDGALSIRLGKAGIHSNLGQLKTALEKKLQEKDALAIVTVSDSESNLLSDPTQPTKGWCTPRYELEVGGIDLLALLYKFLLIAKFIIDNRISIAYKEYEEVPADEGLDPSQEVGSTTPSEQGAATSPPDQGLPTPQPNVGQPGAQDTPAAFSPTPTSTAVNIDIWSIVLGLLDGYWDHVIPFLPSDLQPWARHLQKGTLQEAVRNIVDIEGMTNELETRTNAFLKLFDDQLRPDFYNATTKELVIAGEGFTLSMATDKEDSLVDHIPTVTYDASDSTQPDVTINADKTLTIALGAASTPTTAGQLKTALEQQPEIATATLADFKVDTLLPEAYDVQVVPDSYNSATGELMLTGRKFTLHGTALTDHTPKLVYDQDSSTPIITVESDQTLTIQLGKKENLTPVAALESELEAKIGSVTSVIDHRGDQLLINNYDHSTQKLTLCGKIFTLKLASDDSDALQDHTPNVGLIIHAKPKVSIENDIFTIQLGVEESPTTVGLLKECLEKNVHIDTVTSDEEDHTELIPDDYTPANGELLISGQLLTLTLNTPEALNDQFLVVNYDQVTSTPTVAITADAFTISLGTASTPTTVNELKTALEANAKIASVAIDDGTKTLLPNSYDVSTGELILSGKKLTINFATGKGGMLTAAHLLIAKYRLEVDTEPVVVINADKELQLCIGSNAFPSSTYELKEVMEAIPEIEVLEGAFPTLQTATRESVEFIFPLLKSMISQVLGDYSSPLVRSNYNSTTQELTVLGKKCVLTMAVGFENAFDNHIPTITYDTTTSVSLSGGSLDITLDNNSPTSLNQLKTNLEELKEVKSVKTVDNAYTMLHGDTYNATSAELLVAGNKFKITTPEGKTKMIGYTLVTNYTLSNGSVPTVTIDDANSQLELTLGDPSSPTTIGQLKSALEKELGEVCVEKPGSIAQVTEVPFKLAALFTELALNHIPLPKAFKDFLMGTPKPGEATVSAGCLLLALPYAALEQVLELILTTQEKEQQKVA